MRKIIERLKRVVAAFKDQPRKTYAVIYDYVADGNDDDESYYGYFSSREEALRMFNDCYPPEANTVHNAHLVVLVEELRPSQH
ncbi:hypothetical protein ABE527_02420 [Brucella sp. TWI432]